MLTNGIEGRIRIRLALAENRVCRVSVESTRPVHASRVLEGRLVDEAIGLLPLLFGVCGTAQVCAGLAACEQALEITVTPAQRAARALMVLAETAYEHLSHILLDWPPLLGEPVDGTSLARLRGGRESFRAALFQGRDWHLTGGAELRPDTGRVVETIALLEGWLVQVLFGIPLDRWLGLDPHKTLQEWVACSTAARLLSKLLGTELGGLGRSAVEPMPGIPVEALERALAADHSGQFVAAPAWQGQVYETGALARQRSHPLVSDLFVRYGNGLLARLAARLVELAAIPGRMRELQHALLDRTVCDDGPACSVAEGVGISTVEAARGRLVHRVEVATGRVRRYQTLAPTEWNFHPWGPLVQGLAGMRTDAMDDLYRRVSLVAGALDPCVAYEVEVTGHA